jgi:plastin-1
VVILQAFDKVTPGSVVWRRVSKPKPLPMSPVQATFPTGGDEEDEGPVPHAGLSRFKAVENNNYAVDLAKSNGMHIVGIQGADIVDGTRTLVLGLVWQLMR